MVSTGFMTAETKFGYGKGNKKTPQLEGFFI